MVEQRIKVITAYHYKKEFEAVLIICVPGPRSVQPITKQEALKFAAHKSITDNQIIDKWRIAEAYECRCTNETAHYKATHAHLHLKGRPPTSTG